MCISHCCYRKRDIATINVPGHEQELRGRVMGVRIRRRGEFDLALINVDYPLATCGNMDTMRYINTWSDEYLSHLPRRCMPLIFGGFNMRFGWSLPTI